MAPKKKASRDSSATAGSKTKAKWQPTVPSGAPILPRRKGGRAIACRVRGITWGALDFTVVVDAEQPLFDVVERIVAQHGGAVHADTLVLYRGACPAAHECSAPIDAPAHSRARRLPWALTTPLALASLTSDSRVMSWYLLVLGDPPLSAPLSAELVNPSRLPPKITRGPQRISSRCCHPHAENME